MIEIIDHRRFSEDGILISFEGNEIFFTDKESEKIRNFLNEKRTYFRDRILDALNIKKMTLEELSNNLNVDKDKMNRELISLKSDDKICIENKEVDDPDLGLLFIPLFKKKE